MSIENKDSQILKQIKKPKTKKEKKRDNNIGKNQKKKIKLSKRNKREEEEIQKMIFPAIYKSDGSIDTELLIDILGNKIDRKIIIKLSKVPRYASDLAIDLGISKPAIKKHLDRLEEMGIIIKANPDNTSEKRQYYCLNPDINISLTMDLSPNYFKYQATNTKYITE
ncbi:MAG: ArsR/SmtB family transcription factor, partial [Promethearchaeota archaeon]